MDNDKDQLLPVTKADGLARSTRGGRRRGAGRKPVRLDLEVVERLSAMGSTNEEIAGLCKCSVRTLETYLKKPEFAAAKTRGLATVQISVRRMQLKAAEKGDTRMLIFLGKQILGQHEELPIDGYHPRSYGTSMVPPTRLAVEQAQARQRQIRKAKVSESITPHDEDAWR